MADAGWIGPSILQALVPGAQALIALPSNKGMGPWSGNTVVFGPWTLPEKVKGTGCGRSVPRSKGKLKHEFDDANLALLGNDQISEGDGVSAEPPEAQLGNSDGLLPLFSLRKNDAEMCKMRFIFKGFYGLV
ncbi:hypothetical protein Dimus_016970 [Dionaea muscipula]